MSNMKLCLMTIERARTLGGAPAAAGGWVAADQIVGIAVEDVLSGDDANDYSGITVALLPSDWPEGSRCPLSRSDAERVAARLDRMQVIGGRIAKLAAVWAEKIRAALA